MEAVDVLKNVVAMSMSSVEVSVSTAHIFSGTGEVQRAATSMASAVEELAASIGEIESSATRSSSAARESATLTQKGKAEMEELKLKIAETGTVFETISTKTQDLQTAVTNLSKVVELISKIAGQTNLLALNATIEAARAGEHGKGFSVVASEVKSLSRQTSEATDTIKTQITLLNNSFADVLGTVETAKSTVNHVVGKTEAVAQEFLEINDHASDINHQVGELSNIISEQKKAVQLLAENMHVVKNKGDSNMEAVSTLANQTDKSVQMIEAWRTTLANEDIDNKVIYLAQADHLLWKKRLLDMAIGRSNLKSTELTDHTLCRLGKWYYAQSGSAIAAMPDFVSIELPHKNVHHHGIEAAKCFETNQLQKGLEHYALLEKASEQVIAGLQKLVAACEANSATKAAA